ncbi:MAG: hypothetical protein NTW21_29165 [Verrucomicrobia bacterium]|nr:hypothetical protein [Verrucomicrobiota bacterium]
MIDTTGLRDSMGKVVQSIRDSMPNPEEVKQAAKAASMTSEGQTISEQTSRLEPIVTSLGKVGGGGTRPARSTPSARTSG